MAFESSYNLVSIRFIARQINRQFITKKSGNPF